MFHRNPLRGFGAPGGRNLPIPITLAIGFYNSLHYRASRDSSKKQRFELEVGRTDRRTAILASLNAPTFVVGHIIMMSVGDLTWSARVSKLHLPLRRSYSWPCRGR